MCSGGSVVVSAGRYRRTTSTMPRNDTALTTNTAPGPAAAITRPASAGPIDCATFDEIELSAIAFGSSDRSTSSGVTAMNAGAASVPNVDNTNVKISSRGTFSAPVSSITPSAPAAASDASCVAIMSRRRSSTSASAPASTATRNPGTVHAACTRLTTVGESLRSVTAQLAATVCMKVPRLDTNPAIHSPRNIATRSGVHGLASADSSVTPAPAGCSPTVPARVDAVDTEHRNSDASPSTPHRFARAGRSPPAERPARGGAGVRVPWGRRRRT